MKFFRLCLLNLLGLVSYSIFSQDTIQVLKIDTLEVVRRDTVRPIEVDIKQYLILKSFSTPIRLKTDFSLRIPVPKVSYWKNKNSIGFDFSQIAFLNWNAGGTSAIAGLLKGNFVRNRSDLKSEWNNELSFRYGLNKQDGVELRKSDDEVRLNSTFGYRTDPLSYWYFSGQFNFNTQFADGYRYPNTEKVISRLFAPAYTFLGIGAKYFLKEKKFDLYISPLTFKNTLVLDQILANNGAFGVTKAILDVNGTIVRRGKKTRTEMGFLLTNSYKNEIWKNITFENRLSLYSDYINNFGNVDIDWRVQFDFVVNKYVRANISANLLYDDDVKTRKEVNGKIVQGGAKAQLRQGIGVGVIYNF